MKEHDLLGSEHGDTIPLAWRCHPSIFTALVVVWKTLYWIAIGLGVALMSVNQNYSDSDWILCRAQKTAQKTGLLLT